jgi:hypothetical protein
VTNYKPTSSINVDREYPEGAVDYPTGPRPPKSDSKNPREDKKTLLDKILGILK